MQKKNKQILKLIAKLNKKIEDEVKDDTKTIHVEEDKHKEMAAWVDVERLQFSRETQELMSRLQQQGDGTEKWFKKFVAAVYRHGQYIHKLEEHVKGFDNLLIKGPPNQLFDRLRKYAKVGLELAQEAEKDIPSLKKTAEGVDESVKVEKKLEKEVKHKIDEIHDMNSRTRRLMKDIKTAENAVNKADRVTPNSANKLWEHRVEDINRDIKKSIKKKLIDAKYKEMVLTEYDILIGQIRQKIKDNNFKDNDIDAACTWLKQPKHKAAKKHVQVAKPTKAPAALKKRRA